MHCHHARSACSAINSAACCSPMPAAAVTPHRAVSACCVRRTSAVQSGEGVSFWRCTAASRNAVLRQCVVLLQSPLRICTRLSRAWSPHVTSYHGEHESLQGCLAPAMQLQRSQRASGLVSAWEMRGVVCRWRRTSARSEGMLLGLILRDDGRQHGRQPAAARGGTSCSPSWSGSLL